jgi:hypothetical protein
LLLPLEIFAGCCRRREEKARKKTSELASPASTQAERNLFRSKPRTKMTRPDRDRWLCVRNILGEKSTASRRQTLLLRGNWVWAYIQQKNLVFKEGLSRRMKLNDSIDKKQSNFAFAYREQDEGEKSGHISAVEETNGKEKTIEGCK